MFDLQKIKNDFKNCECGKPHDLTIKDVVIGSGIVVETGDILKRKIFLQSLTRPIINRTTMATRMIYTTKSSIHSKVENSALLAFMMSILIGKFNR